MNVFPIRNEGGNIFYREYEKKFVKNNNLKNNKTIVAFPNGESISKYNDLFMKNFLNMDVNIKKNKNQKKQKKINNLKNTKFHDLNLNTTIKGVDYSIFCYIVDISKKLEDNFNVIKNGSFNITCEKLEDNDIEFYDDEQLIGNIQYKKILNLVYSNILQIEIPSDSNFWIFGKNSSIMIQSTYIPPENSDEESELLLISDVIDKNFFKLEEKEIYEDFLDNKDNNKLIFILLKKNN